MITIDEAARIATDAANEAHCHTGEVLVCIREDTIWTDYGWVFDFDSKRHLEGDVPENGLLGPGPVLVLRDDGSTHFLGTRRPAVVLLGEWEARRNKRSIMRRLIFWREAVYRT